MDKESAKFSGKERFKMKHCMVLFVVLLVDSVFAFAQEAKEEPEFIQQMRAGFQASYRGEVARFYPRAKEEAWGQCVIVAPDCHQPKCWWYAYRVGNGCLRIVFSEAMLPAQFERVSDWRAKNAKSFKAKTREGKVTWVTKESGLTVLSTDKDMDLDEALERLHRLFLICYPSHYRPPNHKVPIDKPFFVTAYQQSFASNDSQAVAWGTMEVDNQQTTWFYWYDWSYNQLSFLLDCEVGEEFETAVVKAVVLVEGQIPIEDPRVIHIVDGLRRNGQVWLPRGCTGTIFYFRCQEFTGEFFDQVVEELRSRVVAGFEIEEIF